MNKEVIATIIYFIIVTICFCIVSYGVYLSNNLFGIYSFSATFIIIPLITIYFITKQIFKKEDIENV